MFHSRWVTRQNAIPCLHKTACNRVISTSEFLLLKLTIQSFFFNNIIFLRLYWSSMTCSNLHFLSPSLTPASFAFYDKTASDYFPSCTTNIKMSLWCQLPGEKPLISHLTEPAELLPSFVPMGAMVTFKVRTENGNKASQCPTPAQEGAQGARATTIDARPSPGYLRSHLYLWLCSQTNKPHNLFKFIFPVCFCPLVHRGQFSAGKFSANLKTPRQDFTCDSIKFSILLNL